MFSLVSTTLEGNCYLLRYFLESSCLFYAAFNQETRYYIIVYRIPDLWQGLWMFPSCALRGDPTRPYAAVPDLWMSPYDTPRTVGQFPDQL